MNSPPYDEFKEFYNIRTSHPSNKFFDTDKLDGENEKSEFVLEERSFNDDLRQVAVRRLQYIRYVEKNIKGGWTKKNIEPLLEKFNKYHSEPVPSWRTLVYWRERYLGAEEGIASLIPKFHHRGRREDRSSNEELECFNRSVEEKFLKLERLSVIKCYRYYLSVVAKIDLTLETSNQIVPVSLSAYYARINKLPQ